MKTFNEKDVYSLSSCNKARIYIGKKGYFGNYISEIEESIKNDYLLTLRFISNHDGKIDERPYKSDFSYAFFLPEDKIKEIAESYIMKLFLQDNRVNENKGEPFYLTCIYGAKINGYTDASNEIMSYDSGLTFKTLLECFILQNNLKKTEVATELGLSRQLFNFKLNQDKFSRLELLKLKEVLNMSDDSFLLLVSAGA